MRYRLVGSPRLICNLDQYRYVYIQVTTAANVRISSRWIDLLTDESGQPGGLLLTQSDGVKRLIWRGELWAAGDGAEIIVVIV